jgi:hypothetical protein
MPSRIRGHEFRLSGDYAQAEILGERIEILAFLGHVTLIPVGLWRGSVLRASNLIGSLGCFHTNRMRLRRPTALPLRRWPSITLDAERSSR